MNAPMNVRTLAQAIGATILVSFPTSAGSVGVYCTVQDVRKCYDRVDLLVAPVNGTGAGWVSLTRVERTNAGVCTFELPALV